MTTCPQCKRLSRPVVITEEDEPHYTFRKYFCNVCNNTFHTHEYLQSKRSEKALRVKLNQLQGIAQDLSDTNDRLKLKLQQLMLELS